MKRWFISIVMVLALATSSQAQGPAISLTGTTCPGDGCANLDTGGAGSMGVQISGTFVGTLEFEQTIDNTTWVTWSVLPNGSTTAVTSATSTGFWIGTSAGAKRVRVRFSAYTSGTAVVATATSQARASIGAATAPVDATYITQTPNATLTAEQAMSALATGLVKNTTTTGVQSIASAGVDYQSPTGTPAGFIISGQTVGDMLQAATTTTWSRLAAVATGNAIISGGTGTVSSWGKIGLTTHVSGILPEANGGSNNAFFGVTGPTTSVKTFTFPNASSTVLTSNAAVTVAQGGTGLATLTAHALYVGNGTSAPTAVAVCGTGTYVRGVAAADPICSTLTLPNAATQGDLMVATGSNAEGAVAAVASGQVLTSAGTSTVPAYSANPSVTTMTGTTSLTAGSALALGTTSTDGVIATNSTAATSGVTVQISPRVKWRGNAWDTSASQTVDFIAEVLPATAATPTGTWKLGFSRNGGALTYPLLVTSGGNLTALNNIISGGQIFPTLASRSAIYSTADKLLALTDSSTATGMEINNGTPTLGTCTGGTLVSGAHNFGGEVTGNTSGSCIINFGTPNFTNTPFCFINDESALIAVRISARSTSSITVTGAGSGDAFQFFCIGRLGT